MLIDRARRLLEQSGAVYETLPHREAFTAQGVAAVSHVSGWQMAKVIVVRPEGGEPVLAVLPASCRLDLVALARQLDRRRVSLMPETEVAHLFPDCETGAMTPFGNLYGLPVYVDSCLAKAPEVVFQAGNHHEVVRMSYPEFERVTKPVVADFCHH
jgi:Ala-tRNA(Pro) deacylase